MRRTEHAFLDASAQQSHPVSFTNTHCQAHWRQAHATSHLPVFCTAPTAQTEKPSTPFRMPGCPRHRSHTWVSAETYHSWHSGDKCAEAGMGGRRRATGWTLTQAQALPALSYAGDGRLDVMILPIRTFPLCLFKCLPGIHTHRKQPRIAKQC